MSKIIKCKTCNADMASSAKTCPSCGATNQARITKIVCGVLIFMLIFIIIIVCAVATDDDADIDDTNNTPTINNSSNSTTSSDTKFSGSCGISANAEMGSSIIDMPTIDINITNTSGKDIAAIQFYFVPLDVYGKEITGWTSQNKLYTDTTIPAGESTSINYQFIEDSVKRGKLYVYSVYFADGTEWGDKNATTSTILKNGISITVQGES